MRGSALSPDEIRAVAQVHQELGPEYSDAVVESFLAKIDQEIGARIETHLAGHPTVRRRAQEPARLARRRTLLVGAAIGAVGAGLPLTLFAFSMADRQGRSQWLVVIWLVVAVVFVGAMAGAGRVGAPRFRGNAERMEH